MPRRNRPNRNRRIQTPKVFRIDGLIVRALATLPVASIREGRK